MKIEIDIPEEFIEKVMKQAGYKLSDMTPELQSKIQRRIEKSVLANWEDEPHYFYEDYIQKFFPYKG